MPIIAAIVLGLTAGALFGFALEKSRVFEPGMVIGQFQLRNFTLAKVWFTAIATALVGITLLQELGAVTLHPKALSLLADLGGGLLVGAGMALAGGCPALAMAQVGAGYHDSWFTVAGCLTGVVCYWLLLPMLPAASTAGSKALTIPDLSSMPFSAWAVAIAVALFACIVALERLQPWQVVLGSNADGMIESGPQPPAQPVIEFFDPEQTPIHEVIVPSDPR